MKLLSLHVSNFGTLRDYTDRFDAGLNIRLQNNGWGKTTLAAFIKSMFYGLPVSGKRSLLENERKRYTPWQSGTFGGSLDFELSGRAFRIERTFGVKETEDTLTVTDLSTGNAARADWADKPGDKIFGVDADAFARSTYLSGRSDDQKAGLASIQAKLTDLVEASNDLGNYENAMKALDDRRRYYDHIRGEGGLIDDLKNELYETDRQLDRLNAARTAYRELCEKLERARADKAALDERLSALTKRESALTAAQAAIAHQKYYNDLQKDLQTLQTSLRALREELNGTIPSETLIADLTRIASEQAAVAQSLSHEALTKDEQTELSTLAAAYPGALPDTQTADELRALAAALSRAYDNQSAARVRDPAELTYETLAREFPPAALPEGAIPALKSRCLALSERSALAANAAADAKPRDQKPARRPLIFGLIAFALLLTVGGLIWTPLYLIGGIGTVAAGTLAVLLTRKDRKATATSSGTSAAQNDALTDERRTLAADLAACRVALPENPTDALPALDALERDRVRLTLSREQVEAKAQERKRADEALRASAEHFRALFSRFTFEMPQPAGAPSATEALLRQTEQLSRLRARAAEGELQRRALLDKKDALQRELTALLSPYPHAGDTAQEAALYLSDRRRLLTEYARQYDEKKKAAEEYFNQYDMGSPAFGDAVRLAEETDPAALAAEHDTLTAEEQNRANEILEFSHRTDTLAEELSHLDELESRQTALREQIADAETRLSAIQSAAKYLKLARESLSTRYLQTMRARFEDYFSLLRENAPSFTMDTELNVKLDADGIGRASDSFSAGERDLIALCARLALVDAMFEGETPFLLLDDPFTNLDDRTLARARSLLDSLAGRYQILYFVCSETRR